MKRESLWLVFFGCELELLIMVDGILYEYEFLKG